MLDQQLKIHREQKEKQQKINTWIESTIVFMLLHAIKNCKHVALIIYKYTLPQIAEQQEIYYTRQSLHFRICQTIIDQKHIIDNVKIKKFLFNDYIKCLELHMINIHARWRNKTFGACFIEFNKCYKSYEFVAWRNTIYLVRMNKTTTLEQLSCLFGLDNIENIYNVCTEWPKTVVVKMTDSNKYSIVYDIFKLRPHNSIIYRFVRRN